MERDWTAAVAERPSQWQGSRAQVGDTAPTRFRSNRAPLKISEPVFSFSAQGYVRSIGPLFIVFNPWLNGIGQGSKWRDDLRVVRSEKMHGRDRARPSVENIRSGLCAPAQALRPIHVILQGRLHPWFNSASIVYLGLRRSHSAFSWLTLDRLSHAFPTDAPPPAASNRAQQTMLC
jgi:hypothetical protein